MILKRTRSLLVVGLALSVSAPAADIRSHTRPTAKTGAAVTSSQATELTLTLSSVAVRPVQTWVRAAGVIDPARKLLIATLYPPDATWVSVGQRVRVFSVGSRSSMYQARVTRVSAQTGRSVIEVALAGTIYHTDTNYVLEIVTDRGDFLSVPNEAIIEEDDNQIVYVRERGGDYAPRQIQTGIQGELYTQILKGLKEGEEVVTTGSFFIDSEYKMKGTN